MIFTRECNIKPCLQDHGTWAIIHTSMPLWQLTMGAVILFHEFYRSTVTSKLVKVVGLSFRGGWMVQLTSVASGTTM